MPPLTQRSTAAQRCRALPRQGASGTRPGCACPLAGAARPAGGEAVGCRGRSSAVQGHAACATTALCHFFPAAAAHSIARRHARLLSITCPKLTPKRAASTHLKVNERRRRAFLAGCKRAVRGERWPRRPHELPAVPQPHKTAVVGCQQPPVRQQLNAVDAAAQVGGSRKGRRRGSMHERAKSGRAEHLAASSSIRARLPAAVA